MQRIFIIILLLIVGINLSYSQDNRIEEPIKNFEKLWNEFNDRYANFELNKVDWNNTYEKYRPLINEKTTNDSLFSVCNKMLFELKDGHVFLKQYGEHKTIIRNSDSNTPSLIKLFPVSKKIEPNIFQLIETTDTTLMHNGFSKLVSSTNGIIEYSSSKEYGYLRLLGMEGLSMNKFKKHIDNAIKNFKNKNGVIIDIRFNGGGDDKVSFAIANRFTDKKRIGHYKKERKKGTSKFKKLKTYFLKPKGGDQFTKPIVVLTSDLSASAADVFAMIMKELPYVTTVGDNTFGIFSDIYAFKLPNNWVVGLSHQQYFSAEMINYEGIGIEPDIKILNKIEDIENGIDPLIENAIEVLKKKNNR